MLLSASSSRLSLLALSCLGVAGVSRAVSVPFTKTSTGIPSTFVSKDQDSNDTFTFDNNQNILGGDIYVATISVAGQKFEVQMDTGSTDLWLDTSSADLSSLANTGLQTGLSYGDGTVAFGPVFIGNVTFGNFTVSQAFISAPGSNATTNGDKGLLGVGPPLLSSISEALSGTQFNGKSLLENIFESEPSLPALTTFQLSRSLSTGSTDGGVFTVGEIDSDFAGISQEPKLDVVSTSRWIVLLDGMIVNGKNVTGNSAFNIQGQTAGQTLANLDTGTSLGQIPQTYADAIYGSIPGAEFSARSGVYVVPCNANVNVSFVFGGAEYPVHPIDTVTVTTTTNGDIVCIGGFTVGDPTGDSQDFLLGDSFLRNVYSLFDFGAYLPNSNTQPFIQLFSTTDAGKAFSEFDSLSQQRNNSVTKGSSGGGSNGGSNAAFRAASLSLPATLLSLLGLCAGFLFV